MIDLGRRMRTSAAYKPVFDQDYQVCARSSMELSFVLTAGIAGLLSNTLFGTAAHFAICLRIRVGAVPVERELDP